MEPRSVERILQDIRTSAGGTAGRDAARAELDNQLAGVLSTDLRQLSRDITDAKTILGTRLSELTSALGELGRATKDAAEGSSRQAAALVLWTKVYVGVTVAIMLIGLGGLAYQIYSARNARLPAAPPAAASRPQPR